KGARVRAVARRRRGGGLRHGAGRGDRRRTSARRSTRRGARGSVRVAARAGRHALVLRRLRPDALWDRHRELRDVERAPGRRTGRESEHRRPGEDGRGVCARGDEGLWDRMTHDVHTLPPDLPVPQDDGATDHLLGQMLPQLTLESPQGPVSLRALADARLVLYIYPRTGRPDQPVPAAWDAIPGARGCTPESCAFRDHAEELAGLGALVAGPSAQPGAEQIE